MGMSADEQRFTRIPCGCAVQNINLNAYTLRQQAGQGAKPDPDDQGPTTQINAE